MGSYSPSGLGLPRAEWAVGNVAIDKRMEMVLHVQACY